MNGLRARNREVIAKNISLTRGYDETIMAVRAPHVPRQLLNGCIFLGRDGNGWLHLNYQADFGEVLSENGQICAHFSVLYILSRLDTSPLPNVHVKHIRVIQLATCGLGPHPPITYRLGAGSSS